MVNVEFHHCIVHLGTLRKTDRATLQPFDPRAEVQVTAFNALRPALMHLMPLGRQELAIRLPIIGVKGPHLTSRVLLQQAAAIGIRAASEHKSGDLFALPIPAVPAPMLLFLGLDK